MVTQLDWVELSSELDGIDDQIPSLEASKRAIAQLETKYKNALKIILPLSVIGGIIGFYYTKNDFGAYSATIPPTLAWGMQVDMGMNTGGINTKIDSLTKRRGEILRILGSST